MNLFVLRYLFPLVFEGEKTNFELLKEMGGTISNVSHAMHKLHMLGLINILKVGQGHGLLTIQGYPLKL